MSEFKCVRVINKNLPRGDFLDAYRLVCKLESGILSKDGLSFGFVGKSDRKRVFSFDCGAMTTECKAFVYAINHYLGKYSSGVEIIVS